MKSFEMTETTHYIFHYHPNSTAQNEITRIAAKQEFCFADITSMLHTMPDFKIEYYLCDTPEEVGSLYGHNEPCNGFARMPNQIYAVYNENIRCIGFHEDAHVISYGINRPPHAAIREGLAMFFDRKWWDISNLDWVLYYLNSGQYLPLEQIIEDDSFFSHDCTITYPIVGAFTEYLLLTYGHEKYLRFYRSNESAASSFYEEYGKTLSELHAEFIRYIRLFSLDAAVENRMRELLSV